MARKLEPGQYIMTDISSAKVLDLENDYKARAFSFHGRKNQQWEFCPCGTGFIISSVQNGSFLAVQDLSRLHNGSTPVYPGSLPMCWDVEILPVGPTDTELDDVFARIRLPYADGIQMTLGFWGSEEGAPLFLGKEFCTFWRLRLVANRDEQVVRNAPITMNETIVEGGGVTKTVITTTSVTTTTRTVKRIIPGEF